MEKTKLSVVQSLEFTKATAYLEDLLQSFKTGTILVSQGEESLELTPARIVDVEVEAKVKKGRQKFSLELEWEEDAEKPLVITGAKPDCQAAKDVAPTTQAAPVPDKAKPAETAPASEKTSVAEKAAPAAQAKPAEKASVAAKAKPDAKTKPVAAKKAAASKPATATATGAGKKSDADAPGQAIKEPATKK